MFSQYRGLKKEVYVLFYGRIVTNMGAVIWPMMTLILSNKLGMKASDIASLLLVMGCIQLPFSLLGGKVADSFNKKYCIIVCDLVTVACYMICAFIPLSMTSVALFFVAGVFAALEHPAYNALLADLTNANERERAYSLSYLGSNLGLVLAPTIGGFLFEHYLNLAFMITSIATLSSTILIFFFVKQLKREIDHSVEVNVYEATSEAHSLWKELFHQPCVLFYIFTMGFMTLIYSQFNFLMPLNMEMNFGVEGAKYFGMLTSINAIVVIFGTPILTKCCDRVQDTRKMIIGVSFIVFGLMMYIFVQGVFAWYILSMIIFTIGEVLNTLGMSPYISKRVPSTHRGRFCSMEQIFTSGFQMIAQMKIATLVDSVPVTQVWTLITFIGMGVIGCLWFLDRLDGRHYPLLHKE